MGHGCCYIKRFKESTPSFMGIPNPDLTEKWVKQVEKISRVMMCTDDQKVRLEIFMLVGEAGSWWQMTEWKHER